MFLMSCSLAYFLYCYLAAQSYRMQIETSVQEKSVPTCPNLRSPSARSPLDTHIRGLQGTQPWQRWNSAVFQSHLGDAIPHAEDVKHKKEDGD